MAHGGAVQIMLHAFKCKLSVSVVGGMRSGAPAAAAGVNGRAGRMHAFVDVTS